MSKGSERRTFDKEADDKFRKNKFWDKSDSDCRQDELSDKLSKDMCDGLDSYLRELSQECRKGIK